MRHRVRVLVITGLVAMAQGSSGLLMAQRDPDPLLAQAKGALARRDYPVAIAALEQALAEARRAAPLTIESFLVVAGPAKAYGAYAARANSAFRPGEEMHFYLEPKNLVYARGADGLYQPGFDVDFEVVDEDGDTVARQERFLSFRHSSKSALHDIYVNLRLTFEGAPAGTYEVRFTVKDAHSAKSATVKQPFKVL